MHQVKEQVLHVRKVELLVFDQEVGPELLEHFVQEEQVLDEVEEGIELIDEPFGRPVQLVQAPGHQLTEQGLLNGLVQL